MVVSGGSEHPYAVRCTKMGGRTWCRRVLVAAAIVVSSGCSVAPSPTPVEFSSPIPTPTSTISPMATPMPSPTSPPTLSTDSGPTLPPTEGPTRRPGPTPTLDSTPAPTAIPNERTVLTTDEIFPEPPDRDLYELTRSLILKSSAPIPRVVSPDPVSYKEGRRDTFWLTDHQELRTYSKEATLRLVSPHAYWYVEEGLRVSQKDIVKAARIFGEEIYPAITSVFGSEWTPGIDNDPHLTILHARLQGVAGYFSSVDEYPSSVHRYSNQREMIYLNASSLGVGSRQYLAVLAHEYAHAVHWNGDPTDETWITEGLAELASAVAGYRPAHREAFLRSPTTSIVNWPEHLSAHYGAAFLFFDYLTAHYGTGDDLALLVTEPRDGIRGINAYLARLGHDKTFRQVFKDWVVANYLDEPGGGRYSYPNDEVKVRVSDRIDKYGARESSIPQYSAEYTAVDTFKGDVKVRFKGERETSLLPVSLDGERCWWSNRGDSISSSLTRTLDLSRVDGATLSYRIWFQVEEDWDYGYVEVSSDGGITWDIMEAPGTSPQNLLGYSFGPGYTGASDGWLQEEVDLSRYAQQKVLLRFHYVTDQAISYTGLCIDSISVPEIGFYDSGQGEDGWLAEGFVRTDNHVPQDYIVQVIEVGERTTVREMVLDSDNRGELTIAGLENLDEALVVIAALAPKTLQDAEYGLTIEPAP